MRVLGIERVVSILLIVGLSVGMMGCSGGRSVAQDSKKRVVVMSASAKACGSKAGGASEVSLSGGTKIDIPDEFDGIQYNKGVVASYSYWADHLAYDAGKAAGVWKDQGRKFVHGLPVVNGRYGVVVKEVFGHAGDYVDLVYKDGNVLHAWIVDNKGMENAGSPWADYGHNQPDDSHCNVLELYLEGGSGGGGDWGGYDWTAKYGTTPVREEGMEFVTGTIDYVVNYGSMFDDAGGSPAGASASSVSSGTVHNVASAASENGVELTDEGLEKQAWDACKKEGMSDEAAAAVLGNAYQESGWDSHAVDGTGAGDSIGIWQFTNEEKRNYLAWSGNDLSIGKQLEWMFGEPRTVESQWINYYKNSGLGYGTYYDSTVGSVEAYGTYDEFKGADSVERATFTWMADYERPGAGSVAGWSRRLNAALAYYEIFSGSSPATDPQSEECVDEESGNQKFGNSGIADGSEYHQTQGTHFEGGVVGATDDYVRDRGCGAACFTIAVNMLLGQPHKYCNVEMYRDTLGATNTYFQDDWDSHVDSWLKAEGLDSQISRVGSGDVKPGGIEKMKEYLADGNTVVIFNMQGQRTRDNDGNIDGVEHADGHYLLCYQYANGVFLVSDPGRSHDHDACKYTEDQMEDLIQSGKGVSVALHRV